MTRRGLAGTGPGRLAAVPVGTAGRARAGLAERVERELAAEAVVEGEADRPLPIDVDVGHLGHAGTVAARRRRHYGRTGWHPDRGPPASTGTPRSSRWATGASRVGWIAGWWIERGPNGGYVAAVILRALTMAVDDPDRSPRSFTVHFLAPPVEGPVEVVTAIERSGRQLTFVGGRLRQDGRPLAVAQAVFSRPVDAPEFDDAAPPAVPPPEELEPLGLAGPVAIPMRERYETRWAIGPLPFTAGDRAEAGGWIRLTDPRPVDHVQLAAMSDAWLPPAFSRIVRALRPADHRPDRPLPQRRPPRRRLVPRPLPDPLVDRGLPRGGRRDLEPRRAAARPVPPALARDGRPGLTGSPADGRTRGVRARWPRRWR